MTIASPRGEKKPGTFSSESASAAAKKRWEKRRAAEATADADAGRDAESAEGSAAPGRMAQSVEGSRAIDDAVLAVLEREAQAGDIAAARELRAWRESRFIQERSQLADLDRSTRDALLTRLLREIEESEEALHTEGFEAGTQDANDSALVGKDDAEPVGHPRSDGSHRDERGSRPLVAIHEDLTRQMHATLDVNGSHTADGTAQMDIDECIEEATNDGREDRGS